MLHKPVLFLAHLASSSNMHGIGLCLCCAVLCNIAQPPAAAPARPQAQLSKALLLHMWARLSRLHILLADYCAGFQQQ